MASRTASDIYATLRTAGFNAAQATTMTAIALAESSGSDTAVGDVNLENATWGPSYGLFQVRTLKAATGSGSDRDVSWLSGSDANQAKAAYDISSRGSNFSPWTTYTSGAYQKYLGQAQAAAGGAQVSTAGATSGPFPTFGPNWLPWNWPSDAANAATNTVLSGTRSIVVEGIAVVFGVALVGAGLARTFAPQIRSAARAATKAGEVALL